MTITVKNLQKKIKVNPIRIKRLASQVLPPTHLRQLHIFLYLVDKPAIIRLNKLLFHRRSLTDVISLLFDRTTAEVFLCVEAIRRNAVHYRVSFEEEMCRCTLHGMLHLFGYDDLTQKAKKRMWRRQEGLLSKMARQ